MKITDLEVYTVATPPPFIGGMYWILVRLKTNDGIEGAGEVYAATFHPDTVKVMIEDVFNRYLLNQDPHQIEVFFRRAFSSGFTQRPDLSMMGIVSGLEMACWDIIGKAADKPVYALIGGKVHERLRSYTYLYPKNAQGEFDYSDPQLAAECAIEKVKQGFTAVKFDPAGPYTAYDGHQLSLAVVERCVTFCKLLREAVGNQCDLFFGTHGQMTPAAAIRLAKRLEPYDLLWFEEPVPPVNMASMSVVAGQTSIPVAAGERLTTKYEFHRLLQAGVGILQMNMGRVGGILEAKKVAALADVYDAQIAPHLYNGPVGAAAGIQLACATHNFLIMESMDTFGGFYSDILHQPIHWEDGYLIPPSAAGLGIDVNWDKVAKHSPYRGERLHLQMDDFPFDVKKG